MTAICPPVGIGLVALGTGTALIGFGQAADAVVHEDPIRNIANNLGISNSTYDTASEVVPLLTSLGCMAAPSVLSFSALRSGASTASSAVDTVANMSEHANEAEKRVISYETDVYSVYTKGSYNKAPKPNYGPLARDVAGDNRGAALKGLTETKLGGAYKDVPANGGQVHHMPANSISPYSRNKGPGIRMETRDHMETASWGSSKKAKLYRQKQKELIEQGKFREAQQMDIDDVRSKFNDKYDNGIEEMRRYTEQLLNNDK